MTRLVQRHGRPRRTSVVSLRPAADDVAERYDGRPAWLPDIGRRADAASAVAADRRRLGAHVLGWRPRATAAPASSSTFEDPDGNLTQVPADRRRTYRDEHCVGALRPDHGRRPARRAEAPVRRRADRDRAGGSDAGRRRRRAASRERASSGSETVDAPTASPRGLPSACGSVTPAACSAGSSARSGARPCAGSPSASAA